MRLRRIVFAGLTSIFTVMAWAAPAVAQIALPPDRGLPAPGALGLVALTVIGAILLARRK